jgi:hypothetical protein
MAQTGFTPIQLYSTSTAAAAPSASNLTNSTLGSELAINITDGKLFYKDNANAVQVIGWKTVPTTAGGTGLTTYTAGDLSYYASGTTFTKLAIGTAGQILSSTGTAPQWTTLSGVAVTTFSAGTTGFTPNSATSGAITLAGTLTVGNGGTGTATAFTAGSVVFAGASGVYSQSNTNLFWNSSTNCLGIGLTNGTAKLTVAGAGANNAGAAATYIGSIQINEAGAFDLQATGGLEFKGSIFAAGYGSKIFSTDNGTMLFGYRANSATWTESMRLLNSGGVAVTGSSTASGLSIANLSTPTSNNTVDSTTYNVTLPTSAKVFWVSAGSGDGVLVVTNYVTSTITILGTSSVIVASSTPASNQLGIYKSVNSHVVSFVTGSAATSTYGSWQIMSLSSTVS